MTHRDYTVKDFLYDDSFRKWIIDRDPAASLFWEQWLQDHPDKMQAADEAREVLLLIRFKENYPRKALQTEVWKRIQKTTGQDEVKHLPKNQVISLPATAPRRNRRWKGSLRYAAVLAGFLLAAAIAFFVYYAVPVRYLTDYGEMKTIVLPDNSMVKLNVNSNLRYTRNWRSQEPREVWLSGEAFFSVAHKNNGQRFLVHTNDVTVQVVGTEFNVNSRRIDTKVVLNSGSVRLHLNTGEDQGQVAEEQSADLIMKPGELVSWSSQTENLTTRKVDPERYSSWKEHILIFKDTPITEVTRSLEDNFGLRISLEGDSIHKETFTGTIPMDNVGVFFETLSRSLNVQIIKRDDYIHIVKK